MKQVRVAAVAALVLMSGSAISGSAQAAAQTGKASYYKHGNRTASGEHFNASDYTAAHRTLPFGTRVLVTNLDTGISVIVRVNDRGPFVRSRIIDVSYGAAKVLGLTGTGVVRGEQLYQLIRQSGPVGDRTFEIHFLDAGVRAYAFTFG